ncbi:uncharacterized protein KY384_005795 [Bacidia gigantensis]|uniref:uncharacterized protein n=1 Tax=Bacidia gigantensis TaxID=2732470 RepID=UPI001D04A431|nr:uncharacterized protein KY384_005795 [Bacidia gigantensis]KAG8529160.1 hypothetical protein KY384_005795 [Bacidia gigantensis]
MDHGAAYKGLGVSRARHTRKAPPGTVLALKPSQALQIKPGTTVAEAAQLMAAKREDCVLVTDDDERIAGIFTAKDLAFRVVGAGIKAREVNISEIMTKNPMCARTDTSATDALDLMVRKGFRHLPVMDENQDISGILDITKCFYDAMEKLERAYSSSRKLYDALEGVQSELGSSQPQQIIQYVEALRQKMSGPTLESVLNGMPPTTVSVRTTVKEAAMLMKENHTTAVLVQDQGSITGIFTSKDVVLRVIAPGLDPANCSVVRVMTPHPDFAPIDMSIQAALRKMHDGHYLNLPVMNEPGEIVGMVDVLKLTYSTLEQINSMSTGDNEGPAWGKFWLSLDNDSESFVSEGGSHRPHTPGHRSGMISPMPDRPAVDRVDSVQPHESASHHGDESRSESPEVSSPMITETPFPFKFKAPSGRVHKLQVTPTLGIEDLVANVIAKLGNEVEAVGGEAKVDDGRLLPSGFAMSYLDNEGDSVSITVDRDVVDAITLSRRHHREKVDLFIHHPDKPPMSATLDPHPGITKPPTPPPSSTLKSRRKHLEESEDDMATPVKKRQQPASQAKQPEQVIAGVPNELLLPGAIAALAVVIVVYINVIEYALSAGKHSGTRTKTSITTASLRKPKRVVPIAIDMSVLPQEVLSALSQLLQGLGSADNNIRQKAEDQLSNEWATARPDALLMGLVEHIQGDPEASTRSFAAVLFRRIATKSRKIPGTEESKELFLSLPGTQQQAIRSKLLECLQRESIPQVRHNVDDAVAEVARQYADNDEQWHELLQALFQASQSPDTGQREGAFRILTSTPGIIESQDDGIVLSVFTKGFKDDDAKVRISAMEAFSSFFAVINKKNQKKYYALVPELLNTLPPLKEAGDTDNLSKALIALIEIAEEAPMMFKHLFHNLVQFSISVISDKELTNQTRQNALELMGTFADSAPALCRKDPSYTSDMVTQCLSLMTDVGEDDEDAEEWNASEDLDVEESDLNHVAGEQCMDRLANKLGGPAILPCTFTWLPRMISSTGWRDRHAALMAISAISEGCQELMVAELDKVLELVVPALRDPHSRVRWAGCNALGQMSTDFAGTMQSKYHQIVLPNIIPVLDAPEPRIQSHAAAALVNFCEEAEKEILEPYLDELLTRLLKILQSPKRYVQEQALSTIATIADSAENAFAKYYDTLMPMLFNVLQEEQSKELRLLRAKAMECATLIALAVGRQKMGNDAITLVQILGRVQQSIVDADDPQSQYLLHCWGRMCRVLGKEFVPYLVGVMPPLMQLASAKADLQLLDDDEQAAKVSQDEGWETVPLKGKIIGIKTSVLEDKHRAIELICIYAQNLEAAFEPYVEEIMSKVSLPSLAFFFHDPTRVAAAKSVPVLLNAVKEGAGERSQKLQDIWAVTVDKLLEVLTAEPAIDTLAEMYQCFYECLEIVGKNCLTAEHMGAFIGAAKETLEDYQTRVKNRQEEWQEIEEGEEESEETLFAIEDDQTLLSDMNKAFHTIFKNQETSFLPAWARLRPFYDSFITSNDSTQRQWALCIMDDVLEFCGDQSWSYQQHIRQPLIDGMRDPIPANRQAACYGVGIAAQKGGQNWSAFVAEALPTLFQVTQMSNARMDDHVFATENACAAIAKIMQTNSSKVPNLQEVLQHWLQTLPVVNDEEAAPYSYMFLASLIEQ